VFCDLLKIAVMALVALQVTNAPFLPKKCPLSLFATLVQTELLSLPIIDHI